MRRFALLALVGSFGVGVACIVNPQPLPPEEASAFDDPGKRDAGRGLTGIGDGTDDTGFETADSALPNAPDDSGTTLFNEAGVSDDASTDAGDAATDASIDSGGPTDAGTSG